MRAWKKTRPTSDEPFMVFNYTWDYRIPDDVLCSCCWISEGTKPRSNRTREVSRWKEQPYCTCCANTLLDPIPFTEVWGK